MNRLIWRAPKRRFALVLAVALLSGLLFKAVSTPAHAAVTVFRSTVVKDGKPYWVTNHLVSSYVPGLVAPSNGETVTSTNPSRPHEYLLVWAGDANVSDTTGASLSEIKPGVNIVKTVNEDAVDDPPNPDFLAVIDADRNSPTYGKVVNTATVGPVEENEPHHTQYIYHKGDHIFAGGLFSSVTYVFDVAKLPAISLAGVSLPTDTMGGSIPDAFWTLPDHTAYGTYMGGPVLPGPYTYTDGQTRVGNGYGGSPGEIIHFAADGAVLSQEPAALPTAEDSSNCPNYPALPAATCANPHGIQARSDLHRLITSDYAEPRNIVLDPIKPWDQNIFRDTVRIYDISDENDPKLVSVSQMPDGPRNERNPGHEEPRGIMETTVTNLPQHKGAFAESMCGGAIFYTPDITASNPVWREVFDDTAAAKVVQPDVTEGAGCDGGGWVQTDPTDHYLYHALIGRNPGSLDQYDTGSPKMVYALDIAKLIAAGPAVQCNINSIDQVWDGGSAPDCPTVASVQSIPDGTTGGPHWGALDNFAHGPDGLFAETSTPDRIAVSDYFVARTGVDGNHKVCMLNLSPTGKLSLDTSFRDENEGTPCVDFNRTDWPHGKTGNANPHSELFVVADDALQ
ncbi:MAG TPA: hypothetical protein VFZ97_10050 [Acidimicrobiales bacterium]